MTEEVRLQRWPGGIITATGGTRTAIKLSRPWQLDIVINPAACPFCTKPQTVLEECGNWLVLLNAFTPFPFHELVVPKECWPKELVRNLGGEERIAEALRLVWKVVRQEGRGQMLHTIYSGWLAGQNVAHLHHHVLENTSPGFIPRDVTGEVRESVSAPELTILEQNGFRVAAGGLRAGQCFILPADPAAENGADAISPVISRIVELYADKFRSEQGLPPDFQLALCFREGEFVYGFYLPILNNWGSTEFLGLMGEQAVILPWPHEETVRHLLN